MKKTENLRNARSKYIERKRKQKFNQNHSIFFCAQQIFHFIKKEV